MSTKVVAKDMPIAVSSLLDTPINGHRPKNWTKTKLLTKTVLTSISKKSLIYGRFQLAICHIAFVLLAEHASDASVANNKLSFINGPLIRPFLSFSG